MTFDVVSLLEIPVGARCLECGYELRGQITPRCPECGRQFDPRLPNTMWLPGRAGAARRHLRRMMSPLVRLIRSPYFLWPLLGIIATALVAVMPVRHLRFWENLVPVALLTYGIGWAIWITIVRRAWLRLRASNRALVRATRWLALVLVAIPLSWTITFHTCPHATVVYLGPLAMPLLVVSGIRCGNSPHVRTVWDIWLGREGTRLF